MKGISFVWFISCLQIVSVTVQDAPESDLSILASKTLQQTWSYTFNITCVESGITAQKSSLSMWMKNSDKTSITMFDSKSSPGINCNFLESDSCNFQENGLHVKIRYPSEMMLDHRFKELPTMDVKCNTPHFEYRYLDQYNAKDPLHISVLTAGDVHISFCFNNDICLWFIIGGWQDKSNEGSALRICSKAEIKQFHPQVSDAYPSDNTACKNEVKTISKDDVNRGKWSHYTISIEEERITLRKLGKTDPVLKYTYKELYELLERQQDFQVGIRTHSSLIDNGICSYWKIHKHKIAEYENAISYFSQGFKLPAGGSCIKILVAMCSECELNISIMVYINEWINIEQQTAKGTEGESQWKEEIICLKTNILDNHNYYINFSNNFHSLASEEMFWAIGTIQTVTSGLILGSNLKSSIIYRRIEDEETVFCENIVTSSTASYSPSVTKQDNQCGKVENSFGANCNISCYSALSKDCNNVIICSDRERGCSCALGYQGKYCGEELYPILLNAPKVSVVSGTEIVVMIENMTYTKNAMKPTTYQIQYKEIGPYSSWNNISRKQWSAGMDITPIEGLKPNTKYEIRAILYDDYTRGSPQDVPTTEIITCIGITKNNVIATPTNLTLSVTSSNDICEYNVEIEESQPISRQSRHYKNKCNINQPGQKCYGSFANLEPGTKYQLNITTNGQTIFVKHITTKYGPVTIRDVSATSDAISITWDRLMVKNTPLNGITYVVNYWQGNRRSCKTEDGEYGNHKSINTTDLQLTIPNLKSYTRYAIEVTSWSGSVEGTPVHGFYGTNAAEYPSDEETPIELKLNTISSYIATIYWSNIECDEVTGDLQYIFSHRCIEEWCPIDTIITLVKIYENDVFQTKQWGSHKVDMLIPFSTYDLIVITNRPSTNMNASRKATLQFKTENANAPKVQNLTVYSKNETSISIRWMKPYPPYGELSKYRIKYYQGRQTKTKIDEPTPTSCKIWPEFHCHDLTLLEKNKKYSLKIAAVNTGQEMYWNSLQYDEILDIITKEEASESPQNFRYVKFQDVLDLGEESDELQLQWNHPSVSNGPIRRFSIEIKTKNVGTNKIYEITREQWNYTCVVDDLKPAMDYRISVVAVNSLPGKVSEILDIAIPPQPPHFSEKPEAEVKKRKKIVIDLSKLNITKNGSNKDSYIYIINGLAESKSLRSFLMSVFFSEMGGRQETQELARNVIDKVAISDRMEKSIVIERTKSDLRSPEDAKANVDEDCFATNVKCSITVVLVAHYKHMIRYRMYALETANHSSPPSGGDSSGLALILSLSLIAVLLAALVAAYFVLGKKKILASPLMVTWRNSEILKRNRTPLVVNEDYSPPNPDIIPNTSSNITKPEPKARKAVVLKPKIEVEIIDPSEEVSSYSKLIPIMEFESYVKEAIFDGELDRQHKMLPRGLHRPHDYGSKKDNKGKNRYNNLIPYDATRVKLDKIKNDEFSDYINANYVDGYDAPRGYIATQGPKSNTVNDFWRMIWQENCSYIVMLANVYENGKKKTEQYWPDHMRVEVSYGEVTVVHTTEDIFADYVYRTFVITCNMEERQVEQMHFTSWPDHGVPIYYQSLVPFLRKMLTIPQRIAPTVIHCSAGVGRTGTVILCDLCLRMAAREGVVDLLACYRQLREQRANMVDNVDQYKLAHIVLVECLFGLNTSIPCDNDFNPRITTILEQNGTLREMQYLSNIQWQDVAIKSPPKYVMEAANAEKNRYANVVPEFGKIFLPRYPFDDPNSDYINAVTVDGFQNQDRFIVTQQPLPNTVGDFWRLVAEKKINAIVQLNDMDPSDKNAPKFWPKDNEAMKPVPFITLKVSKKRNHEPFQSISLEMTVKKDKEAIKSFVTIILLKGWPPRAHLPVSLDNVLMVLDKTDKLATLNNPVLICCHDGQTASGFFVSLSFLLDKMKLEQICDVCQAVRVIRRNKKDFVSTKEQFELLYMGAVKYLSQFETYSNFNFPT